MILGFTSFLASMLVIGASPFLEPRVEPGPDLSMKPSVNNKIKLYRAITNPAEQLLIRSQIGRSPTWMSMGKGDFSPDGFPTLYFFDEPKNAAFWCQSSSKDFCVVATLEWSPPVGVRVKRWTVANSEWHEFLVYNWNGLNGGMLSPIGQNYDWFEGPMSMLLGDNVYEPLEFDDMQHALTNPALLSGLTVTAVQKWDPESCADARRRELVDATRASFKRQEQECDFDTAAPGYLAMLQKTTMWQQYSPSIKMLGSLIRAKADSNKCLGLANSQLQDGSRVQVFDCGRSEVQKWIVDLSAGMPAQIRIAETNFCLDRGMDPVEVGIWTCHDASESAPQQYWVYDPSSGMIVTDFTPNGNIVSANSALNGSPVQMTGIGGVQAGVNTIYLVYWTVG